MNQNGLLEKINQKYSTVDEIFAEFLQLYSLFQLLKTEFIDKC
jgi:hypothetical protein